jgi:hypothetical protein
MCRAAINNEGAHAALALNITFQFESLQRFAQRHTAHVQAFGERAFGWQFMAGGEVSSNQALF